MKKILFKKIPMFYLIGAFAVQAFALAFLTSWMCVHFTSVRPEVAQTNYSAANLEKLEVSADFQ